MPTWSEYREIARGRGDLAKEFYVVESIPVASPERRMEILPRHLEYVAAIGQEVQIQRTAFELVPTPPPSMRRLDLPQ